jgi:hypothetical protein
MSPDSPSYSTVEVALARAGADLSPAEGHGLLCALLCVDPGAPDDRWLEEVLPEAQDRVSAEAQRVLVQVRETTGLQLAGTDSGLRLLLPADDAPLAVRTQALAEWCSAFLYGLGLAGVRGGPGMSADLQEVLQDLSDVTRLEADSGSEEDEHAFVEVSEFVRVAVMLVYEELRERALADQPPRLH